MKVRRPSLDFAGTPPRWARNGEFAQSFNATSLWIPHLERFLNRVLARTMAQMKDDPRLTPKLADDMRTFIKQESSHTALHDAFNNVLRANGYDVAAFEAHFEAEFEHLLATRSLAFLAAYCEGFETQGPPAALVWLDEIEDLLEGARPEVVDLWKWHLLEEYEHRTVCHDVFHAVHGGYFMRLYGFFFQFRQLQGFSTMVRKHLLEVDRAAMTPQERERSIRMEKAISRRLAWAMLPRLLKVLSPFYDPRKASEPRMWRSYMAKLEAGLA